MTYAAQLKNLLASVLKKSELDALPCDPLITGITNDSRKLPPAIYFLLTKAKKTTVVILSMMQFYLVRQ